MKRIAPIFLLIFLLLSACDRTPGSPPGNDPSPPPSAADPSVPEADLFETAKPAAADLSDTVVFDFETQLSISAVHDPVFYDTADGSLLYTMLQPALFRYDPATKESRSVQPLDPYIDRIDLAFGIGGDIWYIGGNGLETGSQRLVLRDGKAERETVLLEPPEEDGMDALILPQTQLGANGRLMSVSIVNSGSGKTGTTDLLAIDTGTRAVEVLSSDKLASYAAKISAGGEMFTNGGESVGGRDGEDAAVYANVQVSGAADGALLRTYRYTAQNEKVSRVNTQQFGLLGDALLTIVSEHVYPEKNGESAFLYSTLHAEHFSGRRYTLSMNGWFGVPEDEYAAPYILRTGLGGTSAVICCAGSPKALVVRSDEDGLGFLEADFTSYLNPGAGFSQIALCGEDFLLVSEDSWVALSLKG